MPITGPLSAIRVIELAGIGPGPFAGMTLADLGADVVRVDRPGPPELATAPPDRDVLNRGKRSIALDLKSPTGVEALRALTDRADVLVEGLRPGVTERLGIGPEVLLERNPRLVYGRMTGWGQDGPLARTAGHDLNYIGVTGSLHGLAAAGAPPIVPFPILGDYAGGAMYLVTGVLAALVERMTTGRGQVVDAAMVDGVSHLMAATHSMLSAGRWQDEAGVNLLDGAAPFYAVYETSDGRYVSVGALEGKFFAELLARLGVPEDVYPAAAQHDRSRWPQLRGTLAEIFQRRTQEEWVEVFAGSDACVAPVVTMRGALDHPQIRARGSVIEHDGVIQPGPAPRFGAHSVEPPQPPPVPGRDTRAILTEAGLDADDLIASGAAFEAG